MGPARIRRLTGRLALATGFVLAACAARAANDSPVQRFELGNLGPFTGILGVPSGWADPTGPVAEFSWEIANHALAQQSDHEALLLDGETHVLVLRLQRPVRGRWSVAMELPWISHGGGFMDRAIDAWHEAFGLSQGIRPLLPTGDLRFVYNSAGVTRFSLDEPTSGFGDLSTSAALRLAGAGNSTGRLLMDVTASIEWPTGDPGRLTGSGGTDIAAGARLAAPAGDGRRLGWAIRAGIVWPGDVDLPLPMPAAHIVYYDASLAWAALGSLDLLLQLQGQGEGYRSDLKMLGSSSLQLGGGAAWRFSRQFSLRFGLFEDIRTDTAPDVSMDLSVIFHPAR